MEAQNFWKENSLENCLSRDTGDHEEMDRQYKLDKQCLYGDEITTSDDEIITLTYLEGYSYRTGHLSQYWQYYKTNKYYEVTFRMSL